MTTSHADLGKRIADLRRRHFGARGKAEFAQRLGIEPNELARYERGKIPPGELLVRICEETGEDLQWLLTGVGSRGTVVISGTRSRHQDLLTRLAAALDRNPALASPVEAFLDLLLSGEQARATQPQLPPEPQPLWIPIYPADRAPERVPRPGEPAQAGAALAPSGDRGAIVAQRPARLIEPAAEIDSERVQTAQIVTVADDHGAAADFVKSVSIARAFPSAFGVVVGDDAMTPMFEPGDIALVAGGMPARPGRAAVCRPAGSAPARCRVWLGEDRGTVAVGRLIDQSEERIPADELAWSLEVLYRLAPAA